MKRNLNSGRSKIGILWLASMIVVLLFTLLPIYIMIKYSFSDKASWSTGGKYPVPWWPFEPTLENFVYYLSDRRFWSNALMSVKIALLAVAMCIVLGVPAAYSFARHKFPASAVLLFLLVAVRMIPDVSAAVPVAKIFASNEVVRGFSAELKIAIAHCLFGLPYMIFVTQGVFETIPVDLDEQAYILGASKPYAFIRIVLPLAVPAIASASIYVFNLSWNEFLYAYYITNSSLSTTTPLAVYMKGLFGISSPSPVQLSLISLIVSVPVIIFTFITQKYIVAGMTEGSVK